MTHNNGTKKTYTLINTDVTLYNEEQVKERESLAYQKAREDILRDLMKVADEGEIEDLRREVERYAKLHNITL